MKSRAENLERLRLHPTPGPVLMAGIGLIGLSGWMFWFGATAPDDDWLGFVCLFFGTWVAVAGLFSTGWALGALLESRRRRRR